MTHQQTFSDHAAAFDAVVDGVAEGAWNAPSPCEGWTAADVVAHVVDSQRAFLARHQVPQDERPSGTADALWSQHRRAVERMLASGVGDRRIDGFFGPTTIGDTLANFYGFDLIVHRWDVATALGRPCLFSDAELDTLEQSMRGFGDHLYDAGVCAPALPPPAGATRQDRVLAALGRDPRS